MAGSAYNAAHDYRARLQALRRRRPHPGDGPLLREGLDGRAPRRAAHRGPRAGDAGCRGARARQGDRLHHQPPGGRDRREGGHQRGHGGVQARVHAGGRGGGRGDRRPPVGVSRPRHLDGRRGRAHDRQRAHRPPARLQLRRQPLRPGLAGQRHRRPRRAAGDAQRDRDAARPARSRHPRASRQVHLRDRRERGGEPVDAAARRAGVQQRGQRGDGHGRGGRRTSSTTSSRARPRASSPRSATTCASPAIPRASRTTWW